jgi:hypothetical protein
VDLLTQIDEEASLVSVHDEETLLSREPKTGILTVNDLVKVVLLEKEDSHELHVPITVLVP